MTLPASARNVRRVGGGDINEAWHISLCSSYRPASERVAAHYAG